MSTLQVAGKMGTATTERHNMVKLWGLGMVRTAVEWQRGPAAEAADPAITPEYDHRVYPLAHRVPLPRLP